MAEEVAVFVAAVLPGAVQIVAFHLQTVGHIVEAFLRVAGLPSFEAERRKLQD